MAAEIDADTTTPKPSAVVELTPQLLTAVRMIVEGAFLLGQVAAAADTAIIRAQDVADWALSELTRREEADEGADGGDDDDRVLFIPTRSA